MQCIFLHVHMYVPPKDVPSHERLTSVSLVSFTLYSRLGGKLYVIVNKIFSCRIQRKDKTNWWNFYEQGKYRYKFILNIYLLSACWRNSPDYKVNYVDLASFFNKLTTQTFKISLLQFTAWVLHFIVHDMLAAFSTAEKWDSFLARTFSSFLHFLAKSIRNVQ